MPSFLNLLAPLISPFIQQLFPRIPTSILDNNMAILFCPILTVSLLHFWAFLVLTFIQILVVAVVITFSSLLLGLGGIVVVSNVVLLVLPAPNLDPFFSGR